MKNILLSIFILTVNLCNSQAEEWSHKMVVYVSHLTGIADGRSLRNVNDVTTLGQNNGDTANIYIVYDFQEFSQNISYVGIFNSGLTALTVVNGLTWVSNVGYGSSSNTTGYLNTHIIMASISSSVPINANNICISGYITGNSTAGVYSDWGADYNSPPYGLTILRSNQTGVGIYSGLCDTAGGLRGINSGTYQGAGFISGSKPTHTTGYIYYNGTSVATSSSQKSAQLTPTLPLLIAATNFSTSSITAALQNTPYIYADWWYCTATITEAEKIYLHNQMGR